MKRFLSIFLTVVFALTLLAGCSKGSSNIGSLSVGPSESSLPSVADSSPSASASTSVVNPGSSVGKVTSGSLEHQTDTEDAPVVYMTTDISAAGLMAVYKALGRTATGKVAVKLHTGEGENSYYLRPELIKDLVQSVNGTIVECNTAYGGSRSNTALHMQVAEDRGFTAIAPVDIMDADGGVEIPVVGGTHLKTDLVGSHFMNYDFFIMLSHFKGHSIGGFGGALKNMSIGIASSQGKSLIHTAGAETTGFGRNVPPAIFTECMAEAAKSVYDYLDHGNKMLYINVMNNISVDCDCVPNPAEPDMHDIGILASLDPVALDQACVDLIYAASDGASVIQRIEFREGTHILEHAQEINFGNREYRLVSIDG